MSWVDNPKKWWVYRWAHHFWVLSFNRNSALYRVVWWSKFTRPLLYNTHGRIRTTGTGAIGFLFWFFILVFILWIIRY